MSILYPVVCPVTLTIVSMYLVLGGVPFTISDAIDEITEKYRSGELVDSDQCYTVKWMKHLSLDSQL